MFLDILSALLIEPIKLAFEIIYMIVNRIIGSPGLSIVTLSMMTSVLMMLHLSEEHVKALPDSNGKTTTLQTGCQQRKSVHAGRYIALSSILGILLFVAVYQFFSKLSLLEGVSFGPISDLSRPDGLLVLGEMHVNLLPIMMTLLYVMSGLILSKEYSVQEKARFYGMALCILIILYRASSGLVMFWAINSLILLIKALLRKLGNPKKVRTGLCSLSGIAAIAFTLFFYESDSVKMKTAFALLGVALQMPLIIPALQKRFLNKGGNKRKYTVRCDTCEENVFTPCSLFLTLLIGVLIPSTYISASPQDFINIYSFHNPFWYVVYAACLAAGVFLIWMHAFYWLSGPAAKLVFEKLVFVLCGIALINYMCFGTDLGVISANLQYETDLSFSVVEQMINLGVLAAVSIVLLFLFTRFRHIIPSAMFALVIALGSLCCLNIYKAVDPVKQARLSAEEASEKYPQITLSRTGKNVVVIMLDRGLGYIVPYLMEEKSELREQFSGFTYYDNVVSYGMFTHTGSPALLGGYEYTPVEMNRRNTELQLEKHNEALKMMPVAFFNEGFDVTVCDPPLAGYGTCPPLTVFDDYPEINRYITMGRFGFEQKKEEQHQTRNRNFFCFSLMKSSPLFMQGILYNNGWYNRSTVSIDEKSYGSQTRFGLSEAVGMDDEFTASYFALVNLPAMTNIVEEEKDTYLFLSNDTPHAPTLLQKPDYVPSPYVNNAEYDKESDKIRVVDGRALHLETDQQVVHYHVNMATFLQLGKWFDYLRENGVYDNTRIIISADHGRNTEHMDELSPGGDVDIPVTGDAFFPLLMVKDFGETEYTISKEFMTNADVPMLAMQGVIEHPTNPFTGKPIDNREKYAHEQYIYLSRSFDYYTNLDAVTYEPEAWASVHDDRWNPDNWTVYPEKMILDRHGVR